VPLAKAGSGRKTNGLSARLKSCPVTELKADFFSSLSCRGAMQAGRLLLHEKYCFSEVRQGTRFLGIVRGAWRI